MNYLKYLWQKLVSPRMELKDYNIPELVPYCTLFGSRLWGGATRKSDVDFVLAEKDIAVVAATLTSLGINPKIRTSLYEGTEEAVEFTLNGLNYSLTVFEDRHVDKVKECIVIATEFFKEHPIYTTSKESRAKVFTSLVVSYETYDTNMGKFLKKNYPEFLV